MGSISLQSVQVTAKNSTKIRSLCLGVNFGAAVCVGIIGVWVIADTTSEGTAVAEIPTCGAAQANKNKESSKTDKGYFGMTQINVTEQNKYRRWGLNTLILIH